jgi:hypothetical protein
MRKPAATCACSTRRSCRASRTSAGADKPWDEHVARLNRDVVQAFRPACHGGPKGPHYINFATHS